jgi:hypothetical protein
MVSSRSQASTVSASTVSSPRRNCCTTGSRGCVRCH